MGLHRRGALASSQRIRRESSRNEGAPFGTLVRPTCARATFTGCTQQRSVAHPSKNRHSLVSPDVSHRARENRVALDI
ncbi:hypothetical protein BH23BAC4_BH23BAC4_02600 [soil metagenome]